MLREIVSTFACFSVAFMHIYPPTQAQAGQSFTLESYFEGKTVARGVFESKIARTRRDFDVYLTGKWDGKILKLREDFVYADGEKDRKTWVFVKTGKGTYTGTREDVIGSTQVTITGATALFEYDVLIPRKGKKPLKVHFKDRMDLKPNGVIENRARVSKFGLPIGKVAVDFVRGRDISKVPKPSL